MPKIARAQKTAKATFWIGGNTLDPDQETTYTQVGLIKEIGGGIGDTWKTVDSTGLADDYEQDTKTIRTAGDVDLTLYVGLADPGWLALRTALADPGNPYNFKVELDDKPNNNVGSKPTMARFEGLVTAGPLSDFKVNGLFERKVKIKLQGRVFETAKITL